MSAVKLCNIAVLKIDAVQKILELLSVRQGMYMGVYRIAAGDSVLQVKALSYSGRVCSARYCLSSKVRALQIQLSIIIKSQENILLSTLPKTTKFSLCKFISERKKEKETRYDKGRVSLRYT